MPNFSMPSVAGNIPSYSTGAVNAPPPEDKEGLLSNLLSIFKSSGKKGGQVNVLEDPATAQATDQKQTEYQDLAENGNIPQSAPDIGGVMALSQGGSAPSFETARRLRELAHEPVKNKIKNGTLTVEHYIKKALEAEDIDRATKGMPPLNPQEKMAKAEEEKGFWGKLGLDGKTSLLLGATLLGAVKFKDSPEYASSYISAFNGARARKDAKEAAAQDRENKLADLKAERDFISGENRQNRATQRGTAAFDAANRESQADLDRASREFIAMYGAEKDFDLAKWKAVNDSKKDKNAQPPKMSFEDTVKFVTPVLKSRYGATDSKTLEAVAATYATKIQHIRERAAMDGRVIEDSVILKKLLEQEGATGEKPKWFGLRSSQPVVNDRP